MLGFMGAGKKRLLRPPDTLNNGQIEFPLPFPQLFPFGFFIISLEI
jgi:hypothetical protein